MIFPERPCPVCLEAQPEILYTQKFSSLSDQVQLQGYDVALCGKCGAAYADAIPGQDWFDAYYRNTSKYTYEQRDGEESPFDATRFRDIAARILPHLADRRSRIFDFGCATGGLLRQLKDLGYTELLGMDASPASTEIARRLHSIDIVNAPLSKIAQSHEPFDLLIQVGVLEHLCEVQTLLSQMRTVIRPGGLMYIEVPDAVGFDEWPGAPFQQFSIEHLNFFSCASLSGLMERNGFESVEVLRTARDHTSNTKMPVVCGFFKKSDHVPKNIAPDDQTGLALRRYIANCAAAEARVKETIDSLAASREPIFVWGVGTHTLHLLETSSFSSLNVIAFVDSNSHFQSRTLNGRSVIAPSELKGTKERILISSQLFQSEIQDQIRDSLKLNNPLITLYEDTKA